MSVTSEPLAEPEYQRASQQTAEDLRTIAHNLAQERPSKVSNSELEGFVGVVAKMIPAGNVPGLILSGLARLKGQELTEQEVRRDIGLLLRGVQQVLDHAVYGTFFAGPAAVIWGYQKLLLLAGKSPESAFPEGTWQFYVDYALREDTARHTNETDGFDKVLAEHHIVLSELDRMAAWALMAIHILHHYDDLLANEWRERVYTRILAELHHESVHRAKYSKIYQEWRQILPYRRMVDARGDESYPQYRKRRFDEFLFPYIRSLSGKDMFRWQQIIQKLKTEQLSQYQQQLSIVSYLKPEQYHETRTALDLKKAYIGIVYHGHYYFLPVCKPGTTRPADIQTVRSQLATIMKNPSRSSPADLSDLVRVQRSQLPNLHKDLPQELVQELDIFQNAPILLNFDPVNRRLPLSELRLHERGIACHAMTIFDTRETFAFDMSHIYFDGAWGAAVSEIMTNEAIKWATRLDGLADPEIAPNRPYSPNLHMDIRTRFMIHKQMQGANEVSAESSAVRLDYVLALRQMFKQRSDLLSFSVNDILVLYRAIHAVTYRPNPQLVAELESLKERAEYRPVAELALKALEPSPTSPAILIPVDASMRLPSDRVYPMSFEVPLGDLHLLDLHREAIELLNSFEAGTMDGGKTSQRFNRIQRKYFSALAGFSAVMERAKEIANSGESASVSTIKLLAHMPKPLQHLLTQIPDRFEVLNDLIRGREVFSNVGQVVSTSTLKRFITAKDDNKQKTLAWGVLTDAQGAMHVSLRDFRPHVEWMLKAHLGDLAHRISQDYLDSYVNGLNQYLLDLQRITRVSRETPTLIHRRDK